MTIVKLLEKTLISAIPLNVETVAIPFEFDFEVSGGIEGRANNDIAQIALLARAWSEWWSYFALDLAAPEEDANPDASIQPRKRVVGTASKALPRNGAVAEAKLWHLGLVHPSDLAGLDNGETFRHAPFSRRPGLGRATAFDPKLAERFRLFRRPGPSEDFAYAFAANPDEEYQGKTQLFCVGIPAEDWDSPLPESTNPFDLVVFEVGFDGFKTTMDSQKSKGKGEVHIVGSTALLVPLFSSLFTQPSEGPIQKFIDGTCVKHGINERLASMHGSTCDVKGNISIDLSHLTSVLETKLRGTSKEDICMFQAALCSLDYEPGPIDGNYGRQTQAGEQSFRDDWNLDGIARTSPEFSQKLIRALRMERSP